MSCACTEPVHVTSVHWGQVAGVSLPLSIALGGVLYIEAVEPAHAALAALVALVVLAPLAALGSRTRVCARCREEL